jgi:inner membrane protein
MASIGHIAVGMAAARIYRHSKVRLKPDPTYDVTGRPSMPGFAIWSALSLLPDIDVIGFGLGVKYEDEWGHRGATHSLTFSIALGLAVGLAAWLTTRSRLAAARTAVIASAVLVSHALLDTLTDGGLGCALLWPFDLTRYFAPWNPIPVAPIGWSFLSAYGFGVALTELILFSPAFWFALSPARTEVSSRSTKWFLGVWVVLVGFIAAGYSLGDGVLSTVLREDTEYASGYSEGSFRTITLGAAEDDVRRLLGPPLSEVRSPAGAPTDVCWVYSRSPTDRAFRARGLCFSKGKVVELYRFWYYG